MRPIGISVPMRTQEFNDTEKLSKVKQEIINNPSKEAQLRAEVVLLTHAIRDLSFRIAELEKK